jgi:hypothetical protein
LAARRPIGIRDVDGDRALGLVQFGHGLAVGKDPFGGRQVCVGLGRECLAQPNPSSSSVSRPPHERDLERVDYLLAVGVRRTQATRSIGRLPTCL